ncbi:NAD(P)-binding protein [Fragilariopsis cylindrus CCMP1102]|uniref:NAD(P)-binding protein n=1 Tax=Fragilariopsis cylindrus CCMP1102 TaxID=635003 RepID=A0A1E7ESP8_9STRA|nr:NAD(P)-binding protein [Fragilariopsis cylindrus CCMP1102]|eukprot:OEU08902.1 NAD(P)-binding protein [Fragilariopsis cylindrus CCMP1102]
MLSEQTCNELNNQSILLTGASGGLGKAIAIQISKYCTPKNLILSGRNIDTLNDIANECRQYQKQKQKDHQDDNEGVHVIPADLSNKESVQKLGESAIQLCSSSSSPPSSSGGIGSSSSCCVDILINCGGISSRSDFIDTKLDIDERVMQINFFSGASLAKILVPGNSKSNNSSTSSSSSKIIWISSVQGLMGIPSRTSYAASKFAVQGYCEALRGELASSNISVHCVSPGYIKTNLSLSAIKGDGTNHGTMDDATSNGSDPTDVAIEILNTVCGVAGIDIIGGNKNDFVVAATLSAKVAIWLRLLCPGLLQNLLVQRYEKAKKKKALLQEEEEEDVVVAVSDKKID